MCIPQTKLSALSVYQLLIRKREYNHHHNRHKCAPTRNTAPPPGGHFYYSHLRQTAPLPGGHDFQPTKSIVKLIRDIKKTNVMTKLQEDRKINETSKTYNVASRVLTRQNVDDRRRTTNQK
ncbi:hypothetical protein DPMN_044828 [Dreissena polymorpha]|uniref:Uncharacterized protein n=1 Tax=Dreissena polymorpha TaxID=45954 RepID=A0A9D4D550_DREPO|nr:hypothetical protein DPMN_044828 [Dreissena polymorpha]